MEKHTIHDYDYVVIGSGFGGSVSALRLAEKGYKVLVIEKGKWYDNEDFPKTNWNLPKMFWAPALRFFGIMKMTFFRHITIPLLSPVTFYLSLIGFIGTFKAFNHIYVMQEPSAQGTVETASVAIFNTFFKASQFGYATAQAMLLFGIILFLTYVQNKIFGERVFYG